MTATRPVCLKAPEMSNKKEKSLIKGVVMAANTTSSDHQQADLHSPPCVVTLNMARAFITVAQASDSGFYLLLLHADSLSNQA